MACYMVALSDLIKQAISLPKPTKENKDKEKKINNKSSSSSSSRKRVRETPESSSKCSKASETEKDTERETDKQTAALLLFSAVHRERRKTEKQRQRERQREREAEEAEDELRNSLSIAPRKVQRILDYCHLRMDAHEELWHYLQKDLLHKDPTSRIRVIQLIHDLAVALPLFRLLLSEQLQWIARSAGLLHSVSMTIMAKERVKGNAEDQRRVEECVKEKIEIWDTMFGEDIEKFHVMRRYFVESLKLDMPNMQDKAMKAQEDELERQRIEARKTLIRGEQILKRGLLTETLQSIRAALDAIEECISILFPDVSNESSSSSAESEQIDNDVDWNTIQWVDADEEEEEEVEEHEDWEFDGVATTHTLPFTIEFELTTNAQEICNTDNDAVIAIIKEHAVHLTKHELPRLTAWKKLFEDIVALLEQFITSSPQDRPTESKVVSMLSLVQASSSLSQARRALEHIDSHINRVNLLLGERCRELLGLIT